MKLGSIVTYVTSKLPEPQAAIVTRVNKDGSLNLHVFLDGSGRTFYVANVTTEPSSAVKHFWREA